MAKITSLSIPPEFAAIFARAVRLSVRDGQALARRCFALPAPDSVAQLALQAHVAACAASWRGLSAWKRTRWTLCAYRHGVPYLEPLGVDGYSGYSLYMRCWITQRTSPPHQPVSPCSRRMRDEGASPHDFTP